MLLPEGAARDKGAFLMKGAGKHDSERGVIIWQLYFYGGTSSEEDVDRPTSTVGEGRRKLNVRVKCKDANNVPEDLMDQAVEAALKVLGTALAIDSEKSLATDSKIPLGPEAAAAALEPTPGPPPGPTPTAEQPFAFT